MSNEYKGKVVVGMSGGVDSSVAAYLLKAAGFEVIGLTLKTWMPETGEESRCCEIDDARIVADILGIPYYVENCTEAFSNEVIKPFMDDYLKGLTPNPCIGCNRNVKWAGMLRFAKHMGADYVATGHYAYIDRMPNGRYTVRQALNRGKDQTYMLTRLSQEQLKATLMPLDNFSKDEVRKISTSIGLPVANKPDSQEICFIPDGDYAGYIEYNYDGEIPGEGNFVDEDGNVLGKHRGIIHYTVGQRRGLRLPLGYPAFVKRIDTEKNEVVISKDDALYRKEVLIRDVNFMGIEGIMPDEKIRCFAKIRYRHDAQPAIAECTENNLLKLTFDEPVRAATPGQTAVFYDEEGRVLGGGYIYIPAI